MPGVQAPPLVCVQYALDDSEPEIIHIRDKRARVLVEHALHEQEWSFHNLAHDAVSICAQWPDLTSAVFAAYDADRMNCTMILARLVAIAEGKFKGLSKKKGSWALDGVAERFRAGVAVDKTDPYRLKYGTLFNVDVAQWPDGAKHYALQDVVAQRAVHRAIVDYAASRRIPLVDGHRQARAGLWLRLMECRGIRVDLQQVEKYIAEVEQEIAKAEQVIRQAGLLRVNGTKDLKAARAWMEKCCADLGIETPKTEKGETALDKDAIDQFGDATLEAYATFTGASTLRKRVEGLRTNVCIQSSFEPLIDSGRTSCRMGNGVSSHGAQLQNPPRNGSFRECFIPRPGFVFSSVDYSSMELCTFSYACMVKVGFSRMGEIINKGGDVNTVTGAAFAGLSEADGYARRKGVHGPELQREFNKRHRALGKTFNYGGLGGMGAAKLALSARKQSGIELTLPESKHYLNVWKQTYPEIPEMFKLISRLLGDAETATVVHLKSGRMRGGLFYTQIANSEFQPIASDIAKDALWRITKECYTVRSSPLFGSRVINFLHDESFLEVPEECAHEAAMRQAEIMVKTAEEWTDGKIKFSAEPALQRRWYKGAEPVYVDGRLVCWEPQ